MSQRFSGIAMPIRAVILSVAAAALFLVPTMVSAQHGHSTDLEWSCDDLSTPVAGDAMHNAHDGHMDHAAEIEFDQLYIDMMLPHHGSIIALSEAAIPHLTDPRLIELAGAIIEEQTAENALLTEWRTEWYGSGEPATGEAMMELMLEAMPVTTMDQMMHEMDPHAQLASFCRAEDPDLSFIHQVIRHHQLAVDVSVIAVERAVHPELAEFAAEVIEAQQAEIDLLNDILAEYEDAATPEA